MARNTSKRGSSAGSVALFASSFSACSTAEIERCSSRMVRMALFIVDSGSDHFRIARARRALAEITVENHAHRAHQQPAARRDLDPLRRQLDQPLGLQAAQVGELRPEVALEVDEV